MNPLSSLTYYRRHKHSALLLVALIALTTIGLYVMAAVLDTIPACGQYIYLTKVSRVYPAAGDTLEPGVVAQIETHPDVARVIPDNGLSLAPPTLIGSDRFRLMGVSQEDARYLIAQYGARLKEGRLFEPRTNEIVLAEETALTLGVKMGSQIARSINDMYYASVPAPLVVVGILEADPSVRSGPGIRVGFASREYLDSHESFAPRMQGVLVSAREGREEAVEQFLDTTMASLRTVTETGSTAGIAWLIGAAVCVVGLGAMQALVYAPRGLSLRFFDVTPWLFTLPIPLAVILVSAGTISRILRRLDPVAIIERR
jgi:hypothetical protein